MATQWDVSFFCRQSKPDICHKISFDISFDTIYQLIFHPIFLSHSLLWPEKKNFPERTAKKFPVDELLCTLRTKSSSKHQFWCSSLSQIGHLYWCLEGPNSTWRNHRRNIVQVDPNIQLWFFQVPIGSSRHWHKSPIWEKINHQKWYLEVLFVLRMLQNHWSRGTLWDCRSMSEQ